MDFKFTVKAKCSYIVLQLFLLLKLIFTKNLIVRTW